MSSCTNSFQTRRSLSTVTQVGMN